jgi:hypothetical protein
VALHAARHLRAAFSKSANESGVDRSSTTPIITSMPASSARGFSSATMPVISPICLSRSTRRRQAGALRLTLAASATFDSEASRCSERRMALSVRSISCVSDPAAAMAANFCCAH